MYTQKELKSKFYYRDGALYRTSDDSRLGKIGSHGYFVTSEGGTTTMVARLIYIFHHGKIPNGLCIDHVDRNRINDRIENLRPSTYQENNWNRAILKNNKTGLTGVSWRKKQQVYRAQIRINGKKKTLCESKCPLICRAQYIIAREMYHVHTTPKG